MICPLGVCNAGGVCVQCNVVAQCAGNDTECLTRTCIGGTCGAVVADAGTPLASQTPGDCLQTQCMGDGGSETVA